MKRFSSCMLRTWLILIMELVLTEFSESYLMIKLILFVILYKICYFPLLLLKTLIIFQVTVLHNEVCQITHDSPSERQPQHSRHEESLSQDNRVVCPQWNLIGPSFFSLASAEGLGQEIEALCLSLLPLGSASGSPAR